ncbi:hypothetical protein OG739_26180 [Streptomyces longwoodensis]|uniref:hypothetical protein n=1 Tax=Streptomyces longwoodensis TaxID=68231 RepID=UPI0022533D4B|nr:hypothetical protein [Streptomyces longwoodensis]MCX4996190.1 hypothetical protein [Streptomyces longwoodensis]
MADVVIQSTDDALQLAQQVAEGNLSPEEYFAAVERRAEELAQSEAEQQEKIASSVVSTTSRFGA